MSKSKVPSRGGQANQCQMLKYARHSEAKPKNLRLNPEIPARGSLQRMVRSAFGRLQLCFAQDDGFDLLSSRGLE
ncbi:MAG: hypothetical protein A3H70_05055 [Candidatus Komeilibacteria bacterium RIFCSPLOWO2_02_FULL_48_11]|uniref:Uncharacterized protein n=1 Tax=Candidatus Komeilibacteria bacterium RIFCSPLOWO2_02_FULL_48_11 TaxID=1798553 RepID=A0A1G2BQ39_9BACT|nr:MAG: hypothetical protein A3H70_05055 [Candidatus Komeilibacteria bacterium RIFCSPLOWO2_02_FULL_48_11]